MNSHLSIPMFASRVPAGFPSPAQDYVEESLDLNQLCIQHPTATYFVRASGESMLDAGIHNNDVLVVDRSITAKHGDIVVASLDHSFTVKKLETSPKLRLMPMSEGNDDYSPLDIEDGIDFEVFGVVSFVVHALR
jgi:DNA polymerase V